VIHKKYQIVCCALVLNFATAHVVSAQPRNVDPTEQARAYVDSALTAQAAGDYTTAIALYERANILSPHPVLLFNLAQAHRLADEKSAAPSHRDLARDYYRRFLESKPSGESAALAKNFLIKLDAKYQAEHPAELEAERKTLIARIEQERQSEAAAETAKKQRAAELASSISTAVATTNRKNQASVGATLRWSGIATASVGVASLGLAGYFGVAGHKLAKQLERENTYDPQRFAQGDRNNRYMWISSVAGATMVLGGAGLYYLGWTRSREAMRVGVAPVSSSGSSVVLSMTGRF
jgi:tetratricopeptide (TPR) repeat protein